MKKSRIIAPLALIGLMQLPGTALASCNYTSHYMASNSSPAGIHIMSGPSIRSDAGGFNDQSFNIYQVNQTQFDIKNHSVDSVDEQGKPIKICHNGDVYVTVRYGTDDKNYCDININDGPYEWEPVVSRVRCHGNLDFNELQNGGNSYWSGFNYYLDFSIRD